MNILFCSDNNYVMPVGVLMHSICCNNADCIIHFYVSVNENFSDKNKNSLERIARQYGNQISFYHITDEMTKDFPVGRDDQPQHVTVATYYRLLITKILPDDVHKILYLDGDMIVRHSLKELWETDLTGKSIGAVHDIDELTHTCSNRLPYPMENGYFNAGMMLINVDFWRESKCYDSFMDLLRKHISILNLQDQDLLNLTFWESLHWLPLKYDFATVFVYNPRHPVTKEMEHEVEMTKFDPTIVHYASGTKPWSINCYDPYCAAWRYYWKKSEWKSMRLVGEVKQDTIKGIIKQFAIRHNLYTPPNFYDNFKIRK